MVILKFLQQLLLIWHTDYHEGRRHSGNVNNKAMKIYQRRQRNTHKRSVIKAAAQHAVQKNPNQLRYVALHVCFREDEKQLSDHLSTSLIIGPGLSKTWSFQYQKHECFCVRRLVLLLMHRNTSKLRSDFHHLLLPQLPYRIFQDLAFMTVASNAYIQQLCQSTAECSQYLCGPWADTSSGWKHSEVW